jgi:hypothetical protein
VVVLPTPAGTGTHPAFCTKASRIRAAAAWPDPLWDGGPFTTSSYTEYCGQSAATSPGMAGVYKEQWNHSRDGYGGLPNMPSW